MNDFECVGCLGNCKTCARERKSKVQQPKVRLHKSNTVKKVLDVLRQRQHKRDVTS